MTEFEPIRDDSPREIRRAQSAGESGRSSLPPVYTGSVRLIFRPVRAGNEELKLMITSALKNLASIDANDVNGVFVDGQLRFDLKLRHNIAPNVLFGSIKTVLANFRIDIERGSTNRLGMVINLID
ncbi:MAG TPA: hypothetical protein VG917_03890 [Patescibacteria group bacterium]|nr:hypothetical protein [Patescibacteria group bacterium]